MAELKAKAEAEFLKASANMANLRASANKTGKQCVTAAPFLLASRCLDVLAVVVLSERMHTDGSHGGGGGCCA